MTPLVQKANREGLIWQKISICPLPLHRNTGVNRDTRPQPHTVPALADDPVVRRSLFSAIDSFKHTVRKLGNS